jgi:hypothetical protein
MDHEAITEMVNGIKSAINTLRGNDYVCVNMGSSQLKLFCDDQSHMEPWNSVKERLGIL